RRSPVHSMDARSGKRFNDILTVVPLRMHRRERRAGTMTSTESDAGRSGRSAERMIVLSMLPAGRHEKRIAAVLALASLLIFAALAPWARIPLSPVPAFVPAYESLVVITDLITAVLLFGQFASARSPALLALGAGYLFTALVALCHAL